MNECKEIPRTWMSNHLGTGEMSLPFSCDMIWVSMFQFQEQLGQGCSPEESDTFQAQGWCEPSKCFIWYPSSCMFHVSVLCSRRFRDSWPDAAVPWTPTKAYATAGGIPLKDCRLAKTAARQRWIRNHIAFSVFLQDYLDMMGLSAMFPRVEVFLIQGSPVDMLERPPMDGRKSSWSG